MLLAIDVGNTNIVLGAFTGEGQLSFLSRIATDHIRTVDQYAIEIRDILRLYDVNEKYFTGAILSSVVPPVTRNLSGAVEKLLDTAPMLLGPGLKTGLDIRIDTPGQLGGDMVATAVGAIQKYARPTIIIDMGTATKFSVIAPEAVFLGGAILPGLRISLDALSDRTAQLPRVSLEQPERVICRNTIDCMCSGVLYGNAAMVDGMVERIEDELKQPVTVVATGGYAKDVTGLCRRAVILDQNLLLDGLYRLYQKNK